MPVKSKAQLRWLAAAEERGDVKRGTFKRWRRHTGSTKRLPARKGW